MNIPRFISTSFIYSFIQKIINILRVLGIVLGFEEMAKNTVSRNPF